MIGLLQRVTEADVTVDGIVIGTIGRGLLVLVAVEPRDSAAEARKLAERLIAYRVFPDSAGRMNLSLADIGGELLLISQFTLAADTRKGLRPSFTTAASPDLGERLFQEVVDCANVALPGKVATGRFGADMKVRLVNDGPVTFWLQIPMPGETESP